MSKHLLSFLLSELAVVRVICQHCKNIVELRIENLGTRFTDGTCRICGKELLSRDKEKAFLELDNAIAAITKSKHVEIEFVIPMPPGERGSDLT